MPIAGRIMQINHGKLKRKVPHKCPHPIVLASPRSHTPQLFATICQFIQGSGLDFTVAISLAVIKFKAGVRPGSKPLSIEKSHSGTLEKRTFYALTCYTFPIYNIYFLLFFSLEHH